MQMCYKKKQIKYKYRNWQMGQLNAREKKSVFKEDFKDLRASMVSTDQICHGLLLHSLGAAAAVAQSPLVFS